MMKLIKNKPFLSFLLFFIVMHLHPFAWLGWVLIFDGRAFIGLPIIFFMWVGGYMCLIECNEKGSVSNLTNKVIKSKSIIKKSDEDILKKLFEEG